MRKPSKPQYHSLGALNRAIQREINYVFPDSLRLAGERPNGWPDDGSTEHARLKRQIKSGLAFYCIEGFLWPSGRRAEPISIWIGYKFRNSTRRLFQLGENDIPTLTDVLWSPREPDVQPVAMTTYAEASCYRRAGALLERRFLPLLTSQWRIRKNLLERTATSSDFHDRFRFAELFYFGDYPSREVESMAAEIRHVLKQNNVEPHIPPSASYKKAFERQLEHLRAAWPDASNTHSKPSLEWVRQQLSHPEYPDHVIEDGYANRYRKALLVSLESEDVS